MTDLSSHPTLAASSWLADFSSALDCGDVDAAVALFEPDSYWRDLVSFTWNIRTPEGREASARCSRRGWPTPSRPPSRSRARPARPAA